MFIVPAPRASALRRSAMCFADELSIWVYISGHQTPLE
jgi:hypothetical protein